MDRSKIGKKKGYASRVRDMMKISDVVLEVVDARNVLGTRIPEMEHSIKKFGKKLLIVINKIDLSSPNLEGLEKMDYALVSAKERIGKKKLMEKLKAFSENKRITVGVIGYPDVGKSNLINYLTGKRKVKVEFTPGSTKGQQYIRLSYNILLIDTPGVYRKYETQDSLALKFAYSPDRLEDPIPVAVQIIERYIDNKDSSFLFFYGITSIEIADKLISEGDPVKILEEIGRKRGLLVKRGEVNLPEAAKVIIRDYQKGKLQTGRK